MSKHLYILDAKRRPMVEANTTKWALWFHTQIEQRIVAQTVLNGVMISTVFLGIDMSCGEGPPVLWETQTFCGYNLQRRCRGSWEQAEAMHIEVISLVQAAQLQKTVQSVEKQLQRKKKNK